MSNYNNQLLLKLKTRCFSVYVTSACSQTEQETQTGQFASLTSLHPVSVNDSQAAASPPLLPRVGFTARLWSYPLTPGAVLCLFFFLIVFFIFLNRLTEISLRLFIRRLHQEQWLILLRQRSITGPVAWQRSRPQISTTCTALKSKESALAERPHS